jgi:GNAT superfamily N-acetyltransferase
MPDQILKKIIVRPFNESDMVEIISFDEYLPIALESCNEDDLIFVAELEKIIIGYFIIQKGKEPAYFDDNQKNWAEITELQVHPQHQRKGIGTFLLHFAIEKAKKKGYSKLYVCTDDFNEAGRKLYQKCGFQELNRVIRYRYPLK